LARTNLGLLLKAIEYVTERKKIKHIYFEGNINSYTYADDGASLYDILNLSNGKRHLIKDKLIKSMRGLDELEDYIHKTEDVQLSLMLDIVKDYGNKIPKILKQIKSKHVDNDEKDKAEIIFSTVHRSKGMEYEAIQLVNDFVTEDKIKELVKDEDKNALDRDKINEEINLLYVAITRTKNSLHIPETLLPMNFPNSDRIHKIRVESNKDSARNKGGNKGMDNDSSERYDEIRKEHNGAYRPWRPDLDEELTIMYCEGLNVRDMSIHFGRTKGAIRSRIRKLELEELYG
jgi:F-box protein 18 (helicase)